MQGTQLSGDASATVYNSMRVHELEEILCAERRQNVESSIAQAKKREEDAKLHAEEALRLKHAWSAQIAEVRSEGLQLVEERLAEFQMGKAAKMKR